MRKSLVLFLLLCPAISRAQSGPVSPPQAAAVSTAPASGASSPMTLAQVLDLAHRANPTLQAAQQHLAAVHALEVTAGLRQNPNLVLSGQALTTGYTDSNGPPVESAGVQRLFERGNKRAARLENAKDTTSLTSFQLDDQRRQIDLAVRQAFSRMVYAQAARSISQQNLDGYRHTVNLMRVRLDAGAIDRTDFDRIELQLAGFESDLDNASLALQQSSIALQTLLGYPSPIPDFAIDGNLEPPAVTATLDELRSDALANRPDLKAAEAQVAVNTSAVRLAQANGTADPTAEVDYEHSGRESTVGGSVNIPIRVFDRNQGEKARAGYELQSSQLALTAARNQVLSDVDSSWAGYQTAQTQAARYRSKYLAEASHVRDNIEFSYRNGNATLLDYLSALADYRQVNLTALNSDLQLLFSLEQLSYASHTEILP